MGRAVLVCGGCYAASVVLSLVYLVVGAALTGKSTAAGERGALLVLVAIVLTFLVGAVVVPVGLGPAVSPGPRIAASVAYLVLAGITVLVLCFLTLVVFNR